MLKFTSTHEESFNNDEHLIQTLELVNINAMVISSTDEIGNQSQHDLLFIHISPQSNIDHRYLKNYNSSFPPIIAILNENDINNIPLDFIPDNFIILPCSNQELVLRSIKLVNKHKKEKIIQ